MNNTIDKDFLELLELVKKKCYITDKSNEIAERIKILVEDSIKKVCTLIGADEEQKIFIEPGLERELLLNYCFYIWNDKTTKEFIDNYLDDIYTLQRIYAVKNNSKDKQDE